MFTGGGQLTPTGYVDAAVLAVGAAVLLATAVVAIFLPPGRSSRQPQPVVEIERELVAS